MNRLFKRLQSKMTSQSGASITYALLLFLVCAVVSSVILAAGTAAAGRMSRAVESDQHYYSVTSAATFLKNQLDGLSCVIKTPKDNEGNLLSPGTTMNGVPVTIGDDGSVSDQTDLMASDLRAFLMKYILNPSDNPPENTKPELQISVSGEDGKTYSDLIVDAVINTTTLPKGSESADDQAASQPDRLLTIGLNNHQPEGDQKAFEPLIILSFSIDIETRNDKEGKEGTAYKKTTEVKKISLHYYGISLKQRLPKQTSEENSQQG